MAQFSRSTRIKLFIGSSICLVLFCLVADHFLKRWDKLCDFFTHVILARTISRMIVDNTIHALIAGWSWVNVWLLQSEEEWSKPKTIQVAVCATMASLLDLDHFIAARSLSIEDALNLPNRPFAHNTSLILFITVLLLVLVYIIPMLRDNILMRDLPAMFFIACVSHHLRDACRRGLWVPPFNSIPPLPYRLFELMIPLLPLVVVGLGALPQAIRGRGSIRKTISSRLRDVSPA